MLKLPPPIRATVGTIALLAMVATTLPACYTSRVLSGGAGILMKRRPVDKVLADEGARLTDEERARLELTQRVREFAIAELGLPDNGSYTSYVRLDRSHVVWNVVAAPEFSVEPLHWCFPIVGCVSYRGYFKEARARKFAAKLEQKQNDVSVGGADAYSTLGKFKDPVLSTFLDRKEADLVGLLIHEIAHQQLYVKNDTTFNESFATVVEIEGTRRWLLAAGRAEEAATLDRDLELERLFVGLLLEYRHRLADLYDSEVPEPEKRTGKARILEDLRAAYGQARAEWGGDARYDGWFARPINNARLASVADYHDLVGPLQSVLRESDGDLPTFYERAETLGKTPPEERRFPDS